MPLASIIGHGPIVSLLRHAAAHGRVPQSLLLAGPDGVGKRTIAIALAQAVNCPKRKDGDACGKCPTCLRIARGQHSDVTILDRGEDASIKIGPVRARVLDAVGYRPFEAARRVAIIDDADCMTEQAQDALLKTLEEPPLSAMLILVTSAPDTLTPTVLSRCRRLRLAPLSVPDVTRVLVERCDVDAVRARSLAAASGGSVSRALALEDGDLTEDRDAALELLRAATGPSIANRLRASQSFAKHGSKRRDREALGERLDATAALLRDVGALTLAGSSAVDDPDRIGQLQPLVKTFTPGRVASAFETIALAHDALERNASPKIVADWVAVKLG